MGDTKQPAPAPTRARATVAARPARTRILAPEVEIPDTSHLARNPPAAAAIAPSLHAPRLLAEQTRHEFLADLRTIVHATAEAELAGSGWTAQDCPYIAYWFNYYDRRGAGDIEAALRRYVPSARAALTASDYLPHFAERVRAAIRHWRATAEVDAPIFPALDTPAAIEARFPDAKPLPSAVRTRMEGAFERGLGDVRVHTTGGGLNRAGEGSARAVAVGRTIVFGDRQFEPGTVEGQLLLAHELAHTQQQAGARRASPGAPAGAAHEAEADRVATGVVGRMYAGVRSAVKGVTQTGLALQRCKSKEGPKDAAVNTPSDAGVKPDSPLVAAIKKAIADGKSAAVFDQIRAATGVSADDQSAINAAIDGAKIPTLSDDDKWLAERLLEGQTAGASAVPQDKERDFSDPDPGSGTAITTEVHVITGRSNRRALVIGGVHGSEPEGEVVVRQLLAALLAAKTKPFFTLVLIPRLIAKSREVKNAKSGTADFREVDDAIAKGTANSTSKDSGSADNTEVEPNRNFPLPGTSYDTYKKTKQLLFWDPTGTMRAPKDIITNDDDGEHRGKAVASEHMLAENRMLVHLIERFQPERLVSVHQHTVPGGRGDGPGVFMDPRRPASAHTADDAIDHATDQAISAEGKEDDKLALAMRDAIQRGSEAQGIRKKGLDPLAGNAVPLPGTTGKKPPTVHYKTEAHAEGNSLGDYAPVAVSEGGEGDRPAIATVTIELPQFNKKRPAEADALAKLETIEVDTLMKVFVEDPAKVP